MDRLHNHDSAAFNVLAWTSHSANVEPAAEEDTGADADEPPDHFALASSIAQHFKREPIRYGSEHESLLTKALHGHPDEDMNENSSSLGPRRRSMTSNVSMASTADLSCSTGITTPARTCSPSPRLPTLTYEFAEGRAAAVAAALSPLPSATGPILVKVKASDDSVAPSIEKKRCISFACTAKPEADDRALMPPPPLVTKVAPMTLNGPKRSTIRFACPSRPSVSRAPPRHVSVLAGTPILHRPMRSEDKGSPITVQSNHPPPANGSSRPAMPHQMHQISTANRCKAWPATDSQDLQSELARSHVFAGGEPQEEHWMRQDDLAKKHRITIGDTLEKENAIRKLAKEVEDEAELEDESDAEDEEDVDDDDDDIADEEVAGNEIEEDEVDEQYYLSEDADDGYHTDNEVGFAASDDEDDGLVLWTTRRPGTSIFPGIIPVYHQTCTQDHSDSSLDERRERGLTRIKSREKARARGTIWPGTPELPDSTDFVCGTLDEDLPLEDAYISCVARRKREKTVPIPQDIDPSFPTSGPEDNEEGMLKKHSEESDSDIWLHGKLEDIHLEKDQMAGRKLFKTTTRRSPKAGPPPAKRLHSPAPKARGRLHRKLSDRNPSRWPQSPPLPSVHTTSRSPQPWLTNARESGVINPLAPRPGLTHTTSFHRAPATFAHKSRKGRKGAVWNKEHVRGAIDIVKGLEQKRQRRKEQFYQKYCERARKDKAHAHDRRPIPGLGAQRMKEIGLLMAGKIGQGNYVMSV